VPAAPCCPALTSMCRTRPRCSGPRSSGPPSEGSRAITSACRRALGNCSRGRGGRGRRQAACGTPGLRAGQGRAWTRQPAARGPGSRRHAPARRRPASTVLPCLPPPPPAGAVGKKKLKRRACLVGDEHAAVVQVESAGCLCLRPIPARQGERQRHPLRPMRQRAQPGRGWGCAESLGRTARCTQSPMHAHRLQRSARLSG
jgi:hypothetical protein